MPRTALSILLIGCLALVGAQLSGVHAHLDLHGIDGTVQSAHGHHHDHGDDHDGDLDIQVVDFGLGTSKVVFLPFAVSLTLFVLAPTRRWVRVDRDTRLPIYRRQRWRPPLRAPPL